MGSRYIRGLVSEARDAIYDANPDNFIEFRANEFRKIYYALGLYDMFLFSSEQSFKDYLQTRGFYNISDVDEKMDWYAVRKGVQFVRDQIIRSGKESSVTFCSGIMLKKLAYKRSGRPVAIPRNADVVVEAILEYICHKIANTEIKQFFVEMLIVDVLRYAEKTDCSQLTKTQCRDALLLFQIRMLQLKRDKNDIYARDLLDNLSKISAYKYILGK